MQGTLSLPPGETPPVILFPRSSHSPSYTLSIPSPFALRSPLYTFATRLPELVQERMDPLASPVQSVSEWRREKKAEHDAGLDAEDHRVLVSLFSCDICKIHIGPDYYEQEVWLLPVYQGHLKVGDNIRPSYFQYAELHVCGGCARRKSLPSEYRMIGPEHWTTRVLLGEQGLVNKTDVREVGAVRRAIYARVLAFHRYFTLLLLLKTGLSLSLFLPKQETAVQKGKQAPVLALPIPTRKKEAEGMAGAGTATIPISITTHPSTLARRPFPPSPPSHSPFALRYASLIGEVQTRQQHLSPEEQLRKGA